MVERMLVCGIKVLKVDPRDADPTVHEIGQWPRRCR